MCGTTICFSFLFLFFLWIPTIKPQMWHRNNLSVCLLVPQSCLITPVFCLLRLMALLILKTLLLSSISMPLFLIGKTTPQVICVPIPFLPASVATLWVSIAPWLEPSRLTWMAFFTLFELSMLVIKMYLGLKLKLSVNNQDKLSLLFFELRGLARNVYLVEAVRNEILLTTFFAGLSNPTVQ